MSGELEGLPRRVLDCPSDCSCRGVRGAGSTPVSSASVAGILVVDAATGAEPPERTTMTGVTKLSDEEVLAERADLLACIAAMGPGRELSVADATVLHAHRHQLERIEEMAYDRRLIR